MSFDYMDRNGNAHSIPDYEYDDINADQKEELARIKFERQLGVISCNAKTTLELQRKIFKWFVNTRIKSIVFRYCRKESLPDEYIQVALQKVELVDILYHHLAMLKITLLPSESHELKLFITTLYKNSYSENIYNRVGRIQTFVHKIAFTKFGEAGDISLDTEIMRRMLSMSRLILAIYELRNNGIESVKNEIVENKKQFDEVENQIPIYVLRSDKDYKKNWNKRHLRSLLYFSSAEDREFLSVIFRIDLKGDLKSSVDYLSRNVNYRMISID
jgi:hypothetical protein